MKAQHTIEPAANSRPATKRAPVELPKPRVRPEGDAAWSIDFGNGVTARLERDPEKWPEFTWRITSEGRYESGGGTTLDHAFVGAWSVAAVAPEPVALSRDQVAELARQAEGGARQATKILRELLKMRTGFAWSVTVGRGTAYSWITISSVSKRADKWRGLSHHDQALLSAILGWRVQGSESIRPGLGVRASYVWRIAGYPIPEDLYIATPSWD